MQIGSKQHRIIDKGSYMFITEASDLFVGRMTGYNYYCSLCIALVIQMCWM